MATDTEQDFSDSPEGWANRWKAELSLSRKELEKWHTQGAKVVKRYRDERDNTDTDDIRWNLFTTNVETKQATLYGQTPRVSVSRRNSDSQDDVARVAAEMLERILNADIERDSDTFAQALNYALEDRLLPGLGLVRVRYVAEFEATPETPAQLHPETGVELAPAIPAGEKKSYECVETDYVHWQDVRWSPARTWHEVRWLAFRAEMSREELVKRFGEELGAQVPLNAKRTGAASEEDKRATPWGRAEVWEVWDKDSREVFWVSEGYPAVLDRKKDPLQLEGFFPCPRPLLSLVTTSSMVPRPEFVIAQDLYDEVDCLSQRIKLLTDAVRVAGVYDKTAVGVQRLLTEGGGNVLIPVENWALFAEKGGIKGQIDWLPLEQVVAAINVLSERRMVAKDALYEVTGMADIMRGAAVAGEAATTSAIKARFGSVRLQRQQDEFARFATEAQRLKAELVAKHFEPATILEASNVMQTPDAKLAQAAVELIKSGRSAYRVDVKPEAVALQDFAQLKAEGMEVLMGISTFVQAMAPLAQQMPGSLPFLLQMMQWALSRVRGAGTIEGVLDQAILAAQQAASQPQQQAPNPEQTKVQLQQLKGQQDVQKEQQKLQNALVLKQADVAAHAAQEQTQAEWNTREAAAKQQIAIAGRALQPAPSPFGKEGGL